eukprot:8126120-Pyramimonas_sp.AAC.1
MLRRLAEYISSLSGTQLPSIVGKDWNMDVRTLNQSDWLARVGAAQLRPSVAAYRQTAPGHIYDFRLRSNRLLPKLMAEAMVDETATTFRQLP